MLLPIRFIKSMSISTYTNYLTLRWIHARSSKPFHLELNLQHYVASILSMSIFYPTPSSCSPFSPHTAHHSPLLLPPTPYLLLLLLPFYIPLMKVHYDLLRSNLRNKFVPYGFDVSLPPLVYLEGPPSYCVDGAFGVELEGLL